MKKMILKIEDLEERIAPGLFVALPSDAAGAASASDGAGTDAIPSEGGDHGAATAKGAVSH